MKFKLLTLLFLISAIIAASLFGTLSSYSTTANYEIGIQPNVQSTPTPTAQATIEPTMEPTPTPVAHPVPDKHRIDPIYVLAGMHVKEDTILKNDKGFVFIMGTINQKKQSTLQFGDGQDDGMYLLYFEPDTKIKFSDGTSANVSGFYTITAGEKGVNIFDSSLYEIDNKTRTVKENNADFSACTDEQAVHLCEQRDIPFE